MTDSEHPELDRAACSAALVAFLAEARDLRLAAAADPVHGQRRQRLREWQAARLAQTHGDLLASPRYAQAATFFLSDLYGEKDFSERDAEVERILTAHPAIAQVAVIGVPDERQGEVGKAYVVLRAGTTLDTAGLIGWSRENMANYKVPRHVEFVSALPTNASGKVLKYQLR